MKIKLEFNNTTKEKFSKIFFQKIFTETLKTADMDCLSDKLIELSIALVNEEEINKLNLEYRKKNKPTDVLSFCEYEKKELICKEKNKSIFLGELIVCPEYISKVSIEENEPMEYSLKYIVAHGILHLLGFEHGRKMFNLQREVADKFQK